MKKSDTLFIIIPAYNEELNIESTLKGWHSIISKINSKSPEQKSKLVVLNDGSKDNTLERLKVFKANHKNVVIINKENEGHGPTLIRGYKYAIKKNATWIFQTDSDGQTNPDEFWGFWEDRASYDALFGNRVVRGDGLSRKLVEKVVCLLMRLYFKVKIPDANAPFRLMRTDLVEQLLKLMPEKYNLPNIIISTLSVYYKKRVDFRQISFGARKKGKNSINIKKIFRIGREALPNFKAIQRAAKQTKID